VDNIHVLLDQLVVLNSSLFAWWGVARLLYLLVAVCANPTRPSRRSHRRITESDFILVRAVLAFLFVACTAVEMMGGSGELSASFLAIAVILLFLLLPRADPRPAPLLRSNTAGVSLLG